MADKIMPRLMRGDRVRQVADIPTYPTEGEVIEVNNSIRLFDRWSVDQREADHWVAVRDSRDGLRQARWACHVELIG